MVDFYMQQSLPYCPPKCEFMYMYLYEYMGDPWVTPAGKTHPSLLPKETQMKFLLSVCQSTWLDVLGH